MWNKRCPSALLYDRTQRCIPALLDDRTQCCLSALLYDLEQSFSSIIQCSEISGMIALQCTEVLCMILEFNSRQTSPFKEMFSMLFAVYSAQTSHCADELCELPAFNRFGRCSALMCSASLLLSTRFDNRNAFMFYAIILKLTRIIIAMQRSVAIFLCLLCCNLLAAHSIRTLPCTGLLCNLLALHANHAMHSVFLAEILHL